MTLALVLIILAIIVYGGPVGVVVAVVIVGMLGASHE